MEGSVQSALKSTANSAQQPLEHAEHRAVPPTLSSPIGAVSTLEMPRTQHDLTKTLRFAADMLS